MGAYPPNGYSLFDFAGNVWEWTSDCFKPRHAPDAGKACCVPRNPRVESAAREGEAVETSTSHIGFRCIARGSSHPSHPSPPRP